MSEKLKRIKSYEDHAITQLSCLGPFPSDETGNNIISICTVLPMFQFENGDVFYPEVSCEENQVIQLTWRKPGLAKRMFFISFSGNSIYFCSMAPGYKRNGEGKFEDMCGKVAYEFQNFCVDF